MAVSTVACVIAGDVDGAHRCTPSVTQRGRSLDQGGESVDIRAASKNYDAVRALDNVTLNVAPREFVSLLGPSGSGKTTLLGILGGFIQPSSGSIHSARKHSRLFKNQIAGTRTSATFADSFTPSVRSKSRWPAATICCS